MKRTMDIYLSFMNDFENANVKSDEIDLEIKYQQMFNQLCQNHKDEQSEQVTVVSTMKASAGNVKRFELIVSAMYRDVETKGVDCFVSLLRPTDGSLTYVAMTTYADIDSLKKAQSYFIEREEFTELLPIRDALLQEPQSYQLTYGASFLVDTAGLVTSLAPNRVSVHGLRQKLASDVLTASSKLKRLKMPIEASYISPFATRYFRNNKKGGHKNLRCFPGCRDGSHRELGYCGNSVKVKVVMPGFSCDEGATNSIISFCRFVLYEEDAHDIESSGPRIVIGDSIAESDLKVLVRDQSNQLAPWVKGIPKEATKGIDGVVPKVFEFNGDGISWHYGWKAPRRQSKFLAKPEHTLEVLFFQYNGNKLKCLHILRSPSFSIDCSRRKYHRGESGIEVAVSSAKRFCNKERSGSPADDNMMSTLSEESEVSSPPLSSVKCHQCETLGSESTSSLGDADNLHHTLCGPPLAAATHLVKGMGIHGGADHSVSHCVKQQEWLSRNLIYLSNQSIAASIIRSQGFCAPPNIALKQENEPQNSITGPNNDKARLGYIAPSSHKQRHEENRNDLYARMCNRKGCRSDSIRSCHPGQFSMGSNEPLILPEEWENCAVILESLPAQYFNESQNEACM